MWISSKFFFLRTLAHSRAGLPPAGLWNIPIFLKPLFGSSGLGTGTEKEGRASGSGLFPGCLCAPIGRARRPSARGRAPIGCGRRIRRCPPLIEARGGEKVINLHPSPLEITLTLWQTTTSPLKANEFDLFGCKNTRNRTEDAVTPVCWYLRVSPWCCSVCTLVFVFEQVCCRCFEFCALQTSYCWIILLPLASRGPRARGEKGRRKKQGNVSSLALISLWILSVCAHFHSELQNRAAGA